MRIVWQPSYVRADGWWLRQICSADDLPILRTLICGPDWRKGFEVRRRRASEIWPHVGRVRSRRARKTVLAFTFEQDIRERICEELRPGVYAQWSDPYEWLGLRRSA